MPQSDIGFGIKRRYVPRYRAASHSQFSDVQRQRIIEHQRNAGDGNHHHEHGATFNKRNSY